MTDDASVVERTFATVRDRETPAARADRPAVRMDHVTKAFGNRKVLDDVSFEVRTGQGFVILGRSGTGKSVALRHMVGLLRPDSGRVYVGDDEISVLSGASSLAHQKEDRISVSERRAVRFNLGR